MGWFDEQIRTRIKNDRESFKYSFLNLSSAILGDAVVAAEFNDDRRKTQNAIEEILKYYHVKQTELPDSITEINDILEYLLRPSGIMRRCVKLRGKWYRDGMGALLGQTEDGDTVALIPSGMSGYDYFDYKSGKRIRVTKKNSGLISEDAVCFYKPLPLMEINIKTLITYIAQTLSHADYIFIAAASLAVSLIGLIVPYMNQIAFGQVIPSGHANLLFPLACLLVGVMLSTNLINIVKALIMQRIQTKMNVAVSSSTMARVMALPASFFKQFSAGELSNRIANMNSLCSMMTDALLSTGLSSLFSLIYIAQIFTFAQALAIPAVLVILVSFLFSLASVFTQIYTMREDMILSAKMSGLIFGLFSGIQKIKLSGAEHRAFFKWSSQYKDIAKLRYNPSFTVKILPLIPALISMTGTIIFYYSAVMASVTPSDYMAFNMSFGIISGAMASLASVAHTVARIKPTLELVDPILKTLPEVSTNKRMVSKITGAIELSNVSFRYKPDMPQIIDNLSLKIKAGQYIAIVGKTGCGKSTLMRLLLGFEKPQKGAIYYDGKDMDTLDLKSLRRNMGVVMQNGKLFAGDIYSNITVSAPWLSPDEAMQAARDAGMEEDINNMPMGLHTIVSEGGGGISGGQKQRLMIARAIAPKPKVLMFDEATSALDNITQKQVSKSLDNLKCTRIIIAHRLSTIKECDRIIVLDKGKIVEDGTYDSLIQNDGYFAELVERQRIDA